MCFTPDRRLDDKVFIQALRFGSVYNREINMIKQASDNRDNSSSRKRMEVILKEEEEVSKAFDINKFYQNERLNIRELKLQLEAFKRKKNQLSAFKKHDETSQHRFTQPYEDRSTAKFAGHILPVAHQNNDTLSNIKKKLNFDKKNPFSYQPSYRKKEETGKNSWFLKSTSKNETDYKTTKLPRYASKTKSVYQNQGDVSFKNQSMNSREWARKRCNTGEKPEQSKCSDTSFQKSFEECNFQGKIKLTTKGQISQFQNKIALLWSHYQLVTKLLISLKDTAVHEKPTIVKYIAIVCSEQFQFLKNLLEQLLKKSYSKKEIAFAKRLRKAVALSRLYENMAIIYLSIFICLGLKTQANLTNLIGYSTSNIAFIIKLLALLHKLQTEIKYSQNTEIILQTIASYQKGSYCKKINMISEVILRMQQNNEVISIVHNKLSHHLDISFQDIINDFLKNVDLDTKPFFEYAHYIFQFLAFHLATIGAYGLFPAVEIAPAPYNSHFLKQKTLVIQPWEVLFSTKRGSTFVRAHTQHFLKTVSHYWNIVYWTDLMPKDIDDLMNKLPHGLCLYRYHCKLQKQNFVKLLDRVGCDVTNTLIIDRCEENYKHHRQHGISLPWKGHRRDTRLPELLQLLQPIFLEKVPLKSLIGNIRSKLMSSIKRKNVKQLYTEAEQASKQGLPHRLPTNYL